MDSLRNAIIEEDVVEHRHTSDVHNQRVVVFAPTPQDAHLCRQILEQNDISIFCCDTITSFADTILEGAGIAIIAQEHLSEESIDYLRNSLAKQPKWSEVPILVLLPVEEISSTALQRILSLEHVTLINRPLRIAIFVNTVLAKLRDRMRQFEVRELLREKDLAQLRLRREAGRLDMAIQAGGMAAWEWTKTEIFWSRSLRQLYGFDEIAEPSQAAMFAAIIDEDRGRIVAEWSEAVELDQAFRSEFRIHHPELGQRWLAAIGEPVKYKSGKSVRYSGLQWDVTEQKKWELELRQSRETFKRLIDDSPQGLYVVDADLRIQYASKGARAAFVNVKPFIGRSLREALGVLWPEQFADEAFEHFRHTLVTGQSYVAPTLIERRADIGATEAYDWSLERITLPDNRYGVVCHFYDNTQRQQSVDMHRANEMYFRDIADASPAMLWVTDEAHQCTFLSKSWYETTGQTKDEGMGLGWTHAAHPDDQSRVAEEFLGAARKQSPFWSEFRLRMADGSYRWAVDAGRPRYESDGTFVGYTGYVIDANDRKIFEQSLEKAKILAENANRSRGEFLANMSHEIRTPMAAILGHADILKDHLKDPDNVQVVETIRRNGNFLLNIINDILDLSKIDAGKMEIEKHPVRPDGLLAEVRSLMDVRASEKGIPLLIEFDGPIPEVIETDAIRLRQVLLNLVGNAIKFTDKGKVKVVVAFVTKPDSVGNQTKAKRTDEKRAHYGGNLIFHITDTGIGIKPEDQQALFEPFVQADNTSTRTFGGTGLGLAICRRLAYALGGEVSLESEYGKGSKFTLSIDTEAIGPLVEPNLSLDVAVEQPTEDITISANVLVVDDRRDIRYLAQHFIEKAGGSVLTATNGQEAIDMIYSPNPPAVDLIVMDMQMPIMDGYDASAELRRRGCKLPIIALTANAMKSDRKECLAAGCTDYTTKPLDSHKLIAMIQRLLK
ncbi:hypothetical protein SAMN06265222_110124 [Neorhodopirellula lusitana]|uniref:histidine kinase n=1 Tax=Neorhodopirellula lusitana TaxID=445327 RepID=A0ABY1QCW3_9BACT|nr:PAS domain-containing protein [Neorhodopirellula lusitana]SMP67247.1 hypothetical protein SAMN06265222_110124 [Neorhodopirellula lusitana]